METIYIDPVFELKELLKIDWDKVQDYNNRYTEENQKTYLYLEEQVEGVWVDRVHPAIIKGANALSAGEKRIPLLSILSDRLESLSKFRYFYSEDVTKDSVLFAGYKRRVFPSTLYIRSWEDRDYTPKPDLFHEDIYGHGSALSIQAYADVCQKIGAIVEAFRFHPKILEIMDYIHWYFVEFPLVLTREDRLQIVGPGILSSPKECVHSLEGEKVRRHEIDTEKAFDIFDHACNTKKEIYHLQYDLWVFRNFHDFKELLNAKLPEYLRLKTGILPLPY